MILCWGRLYLSQICSTPVDTSKSLLFFLLAHWFACWTSTSLTADCWAGVSRPSDVWAPWHTVSLSLSPRLLEEKTSSELESSFFGFLLTTHVNSGTSYQPAHPPLTCSRPPLIHKFFPCLSLSQTFLRNIITSLHTSRYYFAYSESSFILAVNLSTPSPRHCHRHVSHI